jgi:hypothetical protein
VYTNSSSCPQQNNDCYFQSISPAAPTAAPTAAPKTKLIADGLVHKIWSPVDWIGHESQGWHVSFLRSHTMGRTACWGVAQLLFFLMQPNRRLQQYVNSVHKALHFHTLRRPMIAVHVRRGDKGDELASSASGGKGMEGGTKGEGWGEWGHEQPLDAYLDVVRRSGVGARTILLVTEDEGVVQEAQSGRYDGEFEFVFTSHPRRSSIGAHSRDGDVPPISNIGEAILAGEIDGEGEALNALTNLLLSIECDLLVGPLSSTWTRMTLLLALGKYNRPMPYRSVELPSRASWQWGFGACTWQEFKAEYTAAHECEHDCNAGQKMRSENTPLRRCESESADGCRTGHDYGEGGAAADSYRYRGRRANEEPQFWYDKVESRMHQSVVRCDQDQRVLSFLRRMNSAPGIPHKHTPAVAASGPQLLRSLEALAVQDGQYMDAALAATASAAIKDTRSNSDTGYYTRLRSSLHSSVVRLVSEQRDSSRIRWDGLQLQIDKGLPAQLRREEVACVQRRDYVGALLRASMADQLASAMADERLQ